MSKDHIKVSGHVKVRHKGKVIYEAENLVVNAGLSLIASRLNDAGDPPSHMAVGDDDTAPAGGDTTLASELFRTTATPAVLMNTVSYSAVFTGLNAGGAETVEEFGIFNDGTAGDMLARFICPTFLWDVGDELEVDWTINIGETS